MTIKVKRKENQSRGEMGINVTGKRESKWKANENESEGKMRLKVKGK
jgi:hypothetical protein